MFRSHEFMLFLVFCAWDWVNDQSEQMRYSSKAVRLRLCTDTAYAVSHRVRYERYSASCGKTLVWLYVIHTKPSYSVDYSDTTLGSSVITLADAHKSNAHAGVSMHT
eukprot:6857-Heterococcus_DN1.PRE.1